jgi:hypothetical protein
MPRFEIITRSRAIIESDCAGDAFEDMNRAIDLAGRDGVEICNIISLDHVDKEGRILAWEVAGECDNCGGPILIKLPERISGGRTNSEGSFCNTCLRDAKISREGDIITARKEAGIPDEGRLHGGIEVFWLMSNTDEIHKSVVVRGDEEQVYFDDTGWCWKKDCFLTEEQCRKHYEIPEKDEVGFLEEMESKLSELVETIREVKRAKEE